jgi:hypothetical protein
MAQHKIQSDLEHAHFKPGSATPVRMFLINGTDALFSYGTAVPSGVSGYAVGGLFIDTDAAADSQLWINTGTAASCTFAYFGST